MRSAPAEDGGQRTRLLQPASPAPLPAPPLPVAGAVEPQYFLPPKEKRCQIVILTIGRLHTSTRLANPGPDLDARLTPPGHQALESVTAKPTATATADRVN